MNSAACAGRVLTKVEPGASAVQNRIKKPEGIFMRMEDIMTTRVVTVGFDDTLATVKEIFDAVKFRHLLVVDEGELYGVVSDRDLFRALSPFIDSSVETARDIGTLNKRVHQIMSRKPVTLPPRAEMTEAVQVFLANQISCIPIVDEQFRPVGIVSWRDILKTLLPPVADAPDVGVPEGETEK